MVFIRTAALLKKLQVRLLLYLALALIFFMPARTALEHHFLYFPESLQEATPSSAGLPYREIAFSATDGTRLQGWLIPGQTGAPVILFCMGNAGNISHRLETLELLHTLGVAVFIFNYRGYGSSEGKASETGTYQDVAGAMQWLDTHGWKAHETIIMGRSLGAAIGLEAALHTPPAGLIMESAFTSIGAMGRHHYPIINMLLGWAISAEYDNRAKISQLQSPLLIIHGTNDTVCPPFMADHLYARTPGDKELVWISGADHNNGFVVAGKSYQETLQKKVQEWTGFILAKD